MPPPCTRWPNVRWPNVCWPNVRWPNGRWPNGRWPSVPDSVSSVKFTLVLADPISLMSLLCLHRCFWTTLVVFCVFLTPRTTACLFSTILGRRRSSAATAVKQTRKSRLVRRNGRSSPRSLIVCSSSSIQSLSFWFPCPSYSTGRRSRPPVCSSRRMAWCSSAQTFRV